MTDADYAARNYTVEGGPDLRTITAFQMKMDPGRPDPGILELRTKMKAHYEKLNATDVQFLQTRTWPKLVTSCFSFLCHHVLACGALLKLVSK